MIPEKAAHHGEHGDTAECLFICDVSPCAPWFK
jgi:hypothetical protein